TEYPNLIATVRMTASSGRDVQAINLSTVLDGFLDWRHLYTEKLMVRELCLAAARHVNSSSALSESWILLGLTLLQVERFDEAGDAFQQALNICRDHGDRYREGRALNGLGLVLAKFGRFGEAMRAYGQASEIYHEVGNTRGLGAVHSNIGKLLQST